MCGTFVIGKAPTPKWMPPELTKWSYDQDVYKRQFGKWSMKGRIVLP